MSTEVMIDKTKAGCKERELMKMCTLGTKIAVVALAVGLPVAAHATRMLKPPMTMEQLTQKSDAIVMGNVVEEQTVVVGKRLETNYTIQVNEALKTRSGDFQPGREFRMTMPGGELTTPPIAQVMSGIPYLAKGEEVCLFLYDADASAAALPARSASPLAGNVSGGYKVVGWNQGRFSVLTDKDSGEKFVTRLNMDSYGLMGTSKEMRQMLKELQEKKIRTIKRNLVLDNDGAGTVRAKDPLEVTGQDKQTLTAGERQRQAAANQAALDRRGVPVQTLESFRQQIQQYVNQ